MEFDLIVKYLNSTNQIYCCCILFNGGKMECVESWYLMPKDKPRKVKCKFYDNVISYRKDIMFFYLGYQYDDNGQT